MSKIDSTWRSWVLHPPPYTDMLVELTRDPVTHGTRWTQRVREVPPSTNLNGLYWRPSAQAPRRLNMGQIMAECDCPRRGACERAERCLAAEPEVNKAPRPAQGLDAMGEPLRSGEIYLSSRYGLIPVTVEGLRWILDRGPAR
jgi:hypothetical protein